MFLKPAKQEELPILRAQKRVGFSTHVAKSWEWCTRGRKDYTVIYNYFLKYFLFNNKLK